MKIGLDFDDVIVDFFNSLLKWHNKNYNRNDKREQFKFFDWGPTWGTKIEDTIKRVNEFHDLHKVSEVLPLEDSINSLNQLSQENELIIITGRPLKYTSRVEEWLLHHFGKKLKVIHAGEFHKGQAATKAEICLELKIPILFEDAPETAINCAKKGINVILFDQPWNQNVEHKLITRVKNWKEAMQAFKNIEKTIS